MFKKEIDSYSVNEISEIALLSIEEWQKTEKIESVPRFTGRWWLRSPCNYARYIYFVYFGGGVGGDYGTYSADNGVRPAFRIPNLESEIGSKIFVENTLCTVIDTDYALSDTVICLHRFDKKSNNYETSELKAFINSEEFKKML